RDQVGHHQRVQPGARRGVQRTAEYSPGWSVAGELLGINQRFLRACGAGESPGVRAPARQGEWHLWVAAAGWAPRLGLVLNFGPGGLEGDIAGARGIGFGFAFLPVALQRGTEMGLVLNSALGEAVRCGGAPAPP